MDLRYRMRLAGTGLLAILDPEKELMPTNGWQVAHDLGRWWDAVLRLEETIGFIIPAELEAASLRNLHRLTDNPARLLANRPDIPWLQPKSRITPHNFRETLLAFDGLIRRRQNSWARETALHLVEVMGKILLPDGTFDFQNLGPWEQEMPPPATPLIGMHGETWVDSTGGSGRAIEALVRLFASTGESAVLELSNRLAEHHFTNTTNPDGSIPPEIVDPRNPGHNHSYHGTLRGLLLFGITTGQQKYVNVVEATYRNAIRHRIVKESGWTPHDLGKLRFPNAYGDPVTDPASAGDSAQLALWLALHAGCDDLLDDVERLVRARLLPAQLTEKDVSRYPEHTFSARDIGAWRIHGASHAEKGCIPDVHAAVIHTLCDIQANIITRSNIGLRINLHFDSENEALKTESTRNEKQAELRVNVKYPDNIMIRIPGWAPESSLRLTVDGLPQKVCRMGVFAWISKDALKNHSRITLLFDLPERYTEEHMTSGRRYRFKWRGDEIIGISPQDNPMPYYPSLE